MIKFSRKKSETIYKMFLFNHVKKTLAYNHGKLCIFLCLTILSQMSLAQSENGIKCSTGSNPPASIESLMNCRSDKDGYSLIINSYFNKKTQYDKPSSFTWSSTENKNDGCIFFKSNSGSGTWIRKTEAPDNKTYTLPLEFCGLQGTSTNRQFINATNAFINAFNYLKTINKSTILSVPKGDFYVNPDFESKIFLVVPKGVIIQGAFDSSLNNITSNIHWDQTDIPVFSFIGSDYSGMKYLNFIFEGYLPNTPPKYSQSEYFEALKLNTIQFENPKTIQAPIFTMNSSFLNFDTLNFSSSFKSTDLILKNKRNFSFGITSFGTDPVPKPLGLGLKGLAKGNKFTNINMKDFVMGILVSGQENCEISNITASDRGDWLSENPGPPGHVIYVTPPRYQFKNQKMVFYMSKNISITNVKESGKGVFLNREKPGLGTIAFKGVNGGKVKNVISNHPMGILQSGISLKNITFENLNWSFEGNVCENIKRCVIPAVFSILTHQTDKVQNSNLKIDKISLTSPNQQIKVTMTALYDKDDPQGKLNNDRITIENFYVKSAQFKLKDDLDYYPVFDLQMKNSQVGLGGKVVYIPTIPKQEYLKYFKQPLQTIIPIKIRENSYNSNLKLLIKPYPGSADFRDPELSSSFNESTDEAPLSGINGSSGSHIKVSF